MEETEKRFRTGLSFPGEHRNHVEAVAGYLSEELGRERVVVFLCEAYEQADWYKLKWRAIRELIKLKQAEQIMFFKVPDRGSVNPTPLGGRDGVVGLMACRITSTAAIRNWGCKYLLCSGQVFLATVL